jgi:predicted nucleic acid-binding protein
MVFDTIFLIDQEREIARNRPGRTHAFLVANANAPLFVSIVSVGEFAEGFAPAQQSDCWMCLRHYTILTIDREIAWLAGQIARELRGTRQFIGDNDVWIAATALRHNLALVTTNAQHFQRISGLNVLGY